MKKLIAVISIVFAAIIAETASAGDAYLYFMVDGYGTQTEARNFDYAVVGVAKNTGSGWDINWNGGSQTYLMVGEKPEVAAESKTPIVAADKSGWYSVSGPAWGNITPYVPSTGTEYAFYIETYKQNGDLIWGYNPDKLATYATLLAEGHIYDNSTSIGNITPWTVPEPTSGLLVLLGLAALALKRKC